MESIIGILFLATFVEGLVEYLFAKENAAQPALKYVALALGVALSIAYNVDLLAIAGMTSAVPLVGNIVSGIVIGRGSNYVNDIVGMLRNRG